MLTWLLIRKGAWLKGQAWGRFTCIPRGRGRWPWRKAPPGRSSPSGTRRRRQSLVRTAARSWTTSKTSPVFTFPRFFGLLRSWTDENRMKVRIKLMVVDEGRTFPIARWRESRQTMSEFGEFSSSGHQDVPTKHGRCSIVEAKHKAVPRVIRHCLCLEAKLFAKDVLQWAQ